MATQKAADCPWYCHQGFDFLFPQCASCSAASQATAVVVKPVVDAGSALGSLLISFQTLTQPSTWVRVGLFLTAVVLLIIGFMVVVSGPAGTAQK